MTTALCPTCNCGNGPTCTIMVLNNLSTHCTSTVCRVWTQAPFNNGLFNNLIPELHLWKHYGLQHGKLFLLYSWNVRLPSRSRARVMRGNRARPIKVGKNRRSMSVIHHQVRPHLVPSTFHQQLQAVSFASALEKNLDTVSLSTVGLSASGTTQKQKSTRNLSHACLTCKGSQSTWNTNTRISEKKVPPCPHSENGTRARTMASASSCSKGLFSTAWFISWPYCGTISLETELWWCSNIGHLAPQNHCSFSPLPSEPRRATSWR